MSKRAFDLIIAGAGVIGLSIARELSSAGLSVCVLDRGLPGKGTSWAGAGILPPSLRKFARHPIEELAAEGFRLYPEFAQNLLEETGIDTGFRQCGALFVARTLGERAALAGQVSEWRATGVRTETFEKEILQDRFPALNRAAPAIGYAVFAPDEAQIRNPDLAAALVASCLKQKVTIADQQGAVILERTAEDKFIFSTEAGNSLASDRVCVCAGAWSAELLDPLGITISTVPVRGQMLLFKLPERPFPEIIYEGMRYVVPRDDGHVLAGSTLERAGFDATTTPFAIDRLKAFARSLLPDLNEQNLVRAWAGLRPGTWDGMPYIGPVPGDRNPNLWISTGHFRSGLLLAPANAVLMRQLILGEKPMVDVAPFRIDRG